VATEKLHTAHESGLISTETVLPIALIPEELGGTHMDGLTYYLRENNSTDTSDAWLLDVGTLAPSGSYRSLSSTLPLVAGRGVHFWSQSLDFPAGSLIAVRFREQGFPTDLASMTVIPHLRIRGGRSRG
jgi:hypothetical protein